MKTISILLALVNSLAAGLVITSSVTQVETVRQAASLWLLTKVLSNLGVIASGILIWVAAGRTTRQGLIVMASLFLVALGTASSVWCIHLALVNGVLKDAMLLYGGSLMAQGSSSIWAAVPSGQNPAMM